MTSVKKIKANWLPVMTSSRSRRVDAVRVADQEGRACSTAGETMPVRFIGFLLLCSFDAAARHQLHLNCREDGDQGQQNIGKGRRIAKTIELEAANVDMQ